MELGNIYFLFSIVRCSKSKPSSFPLNNKTSIIGLKMTPFYYLNNRGDNEA